MNDKKMKFYLELTRQVAEQGTCPRAKVGAVLVQEDRVISMGYNGAPRGIPHCTSHGCWMEKRGEDGTIDTCVKAVHAEANAVINAAYNGVSTNGATMFTTHYPCLQCFKILINAAVAKVIYLDYYDDVRTDNMYQLIANKKLIMYKWRPGG